MFVRISKRTLAVTDIGRQQQKQQKQQSQLLRQILMLSTNSEAAKCVESSNKARRKLPAGGPGISQFITDLGMRADRVKIYPEIPPYIEPSDLRGDGLNVYLDVYGCQMNVSDAEVVLGIMESQGYQRTMDENKADVWLLVTCSIREGAETKIWKKLEFIKKMKRTGKETDECWSVGVYGRANQSGIVGERWLGRCCCRT